MNMLRTPDEVIDALGGSRKASKAIGASQQSVCNWMRVGRIPPEYYLRANQALKRLKLKADPEAVFGMKNGKMRNS